MPVTAADGRSLRIRRIVKMKLTWHPNANQWSKVIGKRPSRDGSKLTQAQFYFGANREQGEAEAAARKAEWQRMKRTWRTAHQPFLETLGQPFADVPHWYRQGAISGHGTNVTPESVEAIRVESERAFIEDVAFEHRDTTLGEAASMFLAHRREREGIDFKRQTARSFQTDLRGALRCADGSALMIDVTATMIDDVRAKIVKASKSRTTAANYANAFRLMLTWYWRSPMFKGGTVPFGVEDVFAKFPRRRKAEPKHLTDDELKTTLNAAHAKRRLYLLLMLNLGMTAVDIASVTADAFNLKARTVKWKRTKNDRLDSPSTVVVESALWPETCDAVRKFITKGGPAFISRDGMPLVHLTANGNRMNAVGKSLQKLFDTLAETGLMVTAKNFRQTGAQKVNEASDYETAKLWLGRGFASVDVAYLKVVQAKMNAATSVVRSNLIVSGILCEP